MAQFDLDPFDDYEKYVRLQTCTRAKVESRLSDDAIDQIVKLTGWAMRHSKTVILMSTVAFIGGIVIANSSGRLDNYRGHALTNAWAAVVCIAGGVGVWNYLRKEGFSEKD